MTIDRDAGDDLFSGLDMESGRWGPPPTEATRGAWVQAVDLLLEEILAREAMLFGQPPSDGPWRCNLYNGYPGTAIFLAAAGRARRNDTALDLAGRLVRSFEVALSQEVPASGAFVGPLSLAIGYRQIGCILGDVDLQERACSLVTRWGQPSSSRHDVIAGNAGTILALLDCRAVLSPQDPRRPQLLRLAESCAEQILRHSIRIDRLPACCPPETGTTPRTGFAHGASGIALALFLLFAETGEPELYRGTCEALAFERALFDGELRSWAVSPEDPKNRPNGWCYGAYGIALARAAIFGVRFRCGLPPGVVSDLRVALQVGWRASPVPLEHLCCGMFSRVEALRLLSSMLGDERPRRAAEAIATWALRAVKARRGFSLGGTSAEENLTLFQGLPGVAYALLRLLEVDDRSPSALLPMSSVSGLSTC
jgi:lantibiotic modifying enzyme